MPDEAGWYPDPKQEANVRFYDGRKWTSSVADAPPGHEVEEPPVIGGLLGLLDHQPENLPPGAQVPLSPTIETIVSPDGSAPAQDPWADPDDSPVEGGLLGLLDHRPSVLPEGATIAGELAGAPAADDVAPPEDPLPELTGWVPPISQAAAPPPPPPPPPRP